MTNTPFICPQWKYVIKDSDLLYSLVLMIIVGTRPRGKKLALSVMQTVSEHPMQYRKATWYSSVG